MPTIKLDTKVLLGFVERGETNRPDNGAAKQAGAKVGAKVGVKDGPVKLAGSKVGIKN
jgi:hypothetical protein